MGRYIGETVELEGRQVAPSAFVWRGERHQVSEVAASGRNVDLASPWYRRRHQMRLTVRTEDGRWWDLRRSGQVRQIRGTWVLHAQLDAPY